jgi:hypothetical protein
MIAMITARAVSCSQQARNDDEAAGSMIEEFLGA